MSGRAAGQRWGAGPKGTGAASWPAAGSTRPAAPAKQRGAPRTRHELHDQADVAVAQQALVGAHDVDVAVAQVCQDLHLAVDHLREHLGDGPADDLRGAGVAAAAAAAGEA